ncbi:hypothetical protein JMJ77_0002255, partial [Colletotrichum scovillei]
ATSTIPPTKRRGKFDLVLNVGFKQRPRSPEQGARTQKTSKAGQGTPQTSLPCPSSHPCSFPGVRERLTQTTAHFTRLIRATARQGAGDFFFSSNRVATTNQCGRIQHHSGRGERSRSLGNPANQSLRFQSAASPPVS